MLEFEAAFNCNMIKGLAPLRECCARQRWLARDLQAEQQRQEDIHQSGRLSRNPRHEEPLEERPSSILERYWPGRKGWEESKTETITETWNQPEDWCHFQQNEQNQPSWCAAGRVWQGPFGLTGWQVNNALFLFYSFSFLLLRFFLLKGRKSWCCQVQQRSATRYGENLKMSQCGAHIQDALLLWHFRWKIYDIKRILADVLITRNGITEELGKRH